jgi:hypothetical protein
MLNKIKEKYLETKHFWTEHKKVVLVFGIILIIAIIV